MVAAVSMLYGIEVMLGCTSNPIKISSIGVLGQLQSLTYWVCMFL